MFWTIALVLFILWVLGFLGPYQVGGIVHLLLVAAIIMLVVEFVRRRQ